MEFAALRSKTYSCLTDHDNKNKKQKDTKNGAMQQKIKFEDHQKCLQANQLKMK